MSVYDEKEVWLRKAIDSILHQTHNGFEFIIVLDKPDNNILWEILKEYEQQDNRVILIKNDHNIGLAASLNRGLRIAKGDYIVRMDADDISVPNRIEVLINFMEKNPTIGVCSSRMKEFGGRFFQNRVVKYSTKHAVLEIESLYRTPIAHAPCIIRGGIIKKFSPLYNEKCTRSQDYELWSRLIHNGVRFATIPKVLYLRKKTSGSGPSPIPYQVIHNQISRKNIQNVLNQFSIVLPNKISLTNIKELHKVIKEYSGNKLTRRQLLTILFLYFASLEVSTLKLTSLLLSKGVLLQFVLHIPFRLLLRIALPKKLIGISINNIYFDKELGIFD